MATEVVMPQMGYDMTEGTVAKWIKSEGDAVTKGDVIAEIETDKATVEMETDTTGILRKILVKEGITVPVGRAIAYVGTIDEPLPTQLEELPNPEPESPVITNQTGVAKEQTEPQGPSGRNISPVAKKIAEDKNIDVAKVTGTGPGGRITKDDVLAFVQISPDKGPKTSTPAPESIKTKASDDRSTAKVSNGRIELSRMGQAIARRTKQSKQEIPHFYVTVSIDMTQALLLRKELNISAMDAERISVNDMIIKGSALALAKYPMFNSQFNEDHLVVAPHINIGIAIGLPEGLIVPALLECETKSLTKIAKETKDLGTRVRSGNLRQEEATGGTFSISNMGMYQVDSFAAIIVAPQSAVLAVGTVRPVPVARSTSDGQDNAVVIRDMMEATLSADHRVCNGTDAAKFINEIKAGLETPSLLIT
jgi:pyruvate dehydrogenase E2 component (dihydrolipoamide acetyltransferase)